MHSYQSTWPTRFGEQRLRVETVLSPWRTRDVEHIGSTAVPGLAAKDIIDMLATVVDIDAARQSISEMASIGWIHAPEPTDEAERRLSFCFPTRERRTHHLHVVEEDSDTWRGWIAFRNYLRSHAEVARQYQALKVGLTTLHGQDPNSRDDYRAGKAAFILRITATALSDPGRGGASPGSSPG